MKNITSRSNKIGDLISAPLLAVVNANASMQQQQAKLLMEICFKKTGPDTFTPLTVDLVLSQSSVDQSTGKTPTLRTTEVKFSVPLVTLVPFAALAVKKADLNFSLEIIQQKRVSESEDKATALTAQIAQTPAKPSSKKDKNADKSQKSLIKVDIQAESVDLPHGLKTILGLYEKSIRPLTMDSETNQL